MKPVYLSKHATDRMLDLGMTTQDIEKFIREGVIKKEGRTKFRGVMKTKKGWIIVICDEYLDYITMITITKKR